MIILTQLEKMVSYVCIISFHLSILSLPVRDHKKLKKEYIFKNIIS
jgi:hypothetical protein